MKIECPKCEATYDVPMELAKGSGGKSQKMRCPDCDMVFSVQNKDAPTSKTNGLNAKGKTATNRIVGLFLSIAFILTLVFALLFWGYIDKETEQIPKTVKPLEVTVDEGYNLIIKDKHPILVVKGSVFNPASETKNHITLEGRIVDKKGKVRFKTQAPCGKIFRNRKLKRTRRGDFFKLYKSKGTLHNCKIDRGKKRKFELIFDGIPPDFKEHYSVQVTVVSNSQ